MKVHSNISLFLISLLIGFVFTSNRGYQAVQEESSCFPIHALFIWHTSSGEDESFFQQRRLIVQLMSDFPQDTNVSVVTIGAANKDMSFKKKDTVMKVIPGNTGNHKIPYLKISSAIFNNFDKHENLKTAEEVFLMVNNISTFDDEDRAIQVLGKKKTSIVLSGYNTDNAVKVWANVASDKRHLMILGDSKKSIKDTVEFILRLSCQDSKLFCDTDQYWTGTRCYRCSYICSHSCSNPSEYCLQACPYLRHSPPDTDFADAVQDDKECLRNIDSWTLFVSVGIPITIINTVIFLAICLCWKLRKKILRCIRSFCIRKLLNILPRKRRSLIGLDPDNGFNDITVSMSGEQQALLPLSSTEPSGRHTDNQENAYESSQTQSYSMNLTDMELKVFSN